MMQGRVGQGVEGVPRGDGGFDADAAAAVGGGYIAFEAAEEGGEAGASADGYYAQGLFCFIGGLCRGLHVWILNVWWRPKGLTLMNTDQVASCRKKNPGLKPLHQGMVYS